MYSRAHVTILYWSLRITGQVLEALGKGGACGTQGGGGRRRLQQPPWGRLRRGLLAGSPTLLWLSSRSLAPEPCERWDSKDRGQTGLCLWGQGFRKEGKRKTSRVDSAVSWVQTALKCRPLANFSHTFVLFCLLMSRIGLPNMLPVSTTAESVCSPHLSPAKNRMLHWLHPRVYNKTYWISKFPKHCLVTSTINCLTKSWYFELQSAPILIC